MVLMDLRIKDVAELLNVSEMTVHRWIGDALIPVYKIHGQYRFSRPEIESWVMSHKLKNESGMSPFSIGSHQKTSSESKPTAGSQKFSLFRAIHKGQVLSPISGSNKEEVIRSCTKLLEDTQDIDSEMLADMLIDRERLQPTALNYGIAVPHTRDFVLSSTHDVVVFAFLDQPIPYGALDGEPVHTLIFLFACNDKRHLHLLAKIAHLSSQQEIRSLLQSKPSKEKLLEFVETWERAIPSPQEE